jgi:repressor of nif and glnA expression
MFVGSTFFDVLLFSPYIPVHDTFGGVVVVVGGYAITITKPGRPPCWRLLCS